MKRCKLQFHGYYSHRSGLTKVILKGKVKGGRKPGRQRKRWEGNITEWRGLEFDKSQREVENGKTGYEIICGTSTTLVLKGMMTMVMI